MSVIGTVSDNVHATVGVVVNQHTATVHRRLEGVNPFLGEDFSRTLDLRLDGAARNHVHGNDQRREHGEHHDVEQQC